jgi:hypothetical protein
MLVAGVVAAVAGCGGGAEPTAQPAQAPAPAPAQQASDACDPSSTLGRELVREAEAAERKLAKAHPDVIVGEFTTGCATFEIPPAP